MPLGSTNPMDSANRELEFFCPTREMALAAWNEELSAAPLASMDRDRTELAARVLWLLPKSSTALNRRVVSVRTSAWSPSLRTQSAMVFGRNGLNAF